MNSPTSSPSANCSKLLPSDKTNFFDRIMCFLKDGCFSFKTKHLVFAWFWPDCLHISWKYRGQVFLKNLKALEHRYWLNLSEIWSQLIFSKSFIRMWLLLSSWRQYVILLFWTVCNLLLNFLFRFGYQAQQAQSKYGWIKALHKSRFILDKVLSICFSCKGI